MLTLIARLTALILLAFSVRRAVLLLAASLPVRKPPPPPKDAAPLTVHVCVPCRNEAAALPGLLTALDRLEYPRAALQVSIVDDASTDGSAAIAHAWAADRSWANVVALQANLGKAQAINEAPAGYMSRALIERRGRRYVTDFAIR